MKNKSKTNFIITLSVSTLIMIGGVLFINNPNTNLNQNSKAAKTEAKLSGTLYKTIMTNCKVKSPYALKKADLTCVAVYANETDVKSYLNKKVDLKGTFEGDAFYLKSGEVTQKL